MRYIPNSPEERDEMLAVVGLKTADELFRSIPADVQLNRDLKITEPLAESEVIAAMEDDGRKEHGDDETVVSRCRRLFALFADDRRSPDPAERIFHVVHAVSARDRSGHAAIYL